MQLVWNRKTRTDGVLIKVYRSLFRGKLTNFYRIITEFNEELNITEGTFKREWVYRQTQTI